MKFTTILLVLAALVAVACAHPGGHTGLAGATKLQAPLKITPVWAGKPEKVIYSPAPGPAPVKGWGGSWGGDGGWGGDKGGWA